MKVTTCTINVGNGEGNRNVVMDLLWFVDLFFILDCPTNAKGDYVEHENWNYELISSVRGGDIEIYARKGMTGWFMIETHEISSVIVRYEEPETRQIRKIGGIYVRPLREVEWFEEELEKLNGCDIIIGDLNARHTMWGEDSGDTTINAYGRRLSKWIERNNYKVAKNEEKTFRQQSTIDITIFKTNITPPKRGTTDRCGLEHLGQIVRIYAEEPKNAKPANINWKKVDWEKTGNLLKEIDTEKDGGWDDLKNIIGRMPKIREGKVKSKWWTKEMESMSKDLKNMRRSGNMMWKTARKVLRNTIISKRFEGMREDLEKMKDVDIFKAIKQLEGRRAIPPMIKEDGTREYDHDKISDMIAEQLSPSERTDTSDKTVIDIDATSEEIEYGVNTSPRNTANGIDGMSYPFIRFWKKVDGRKFEEAMRKLVKIGCDDWKKAETVLIRKGDKETYEVVKSWRMIHLLPVLSKVVDRIILLKLAKTVQLEETQYGSRKNRSTHDAMKQILEFLEYNKDKCTGILSMDVEGGFDKVNIDMLCDILVYRECEPKLVEWVRRWTIGRKIQLRFNGRISKEYNLNKGVPQGSPLSPFRFGVYVADMFRPRFSYRIGLRRMVTSYVDDGAILVATDDVEKTKTEISNTLQECKSIAKDRGMGFSVKKME